MIWWDELGIGYYPVDQKRAPYDDAYFAKYVGYAKTDLGCALNVARGRLVDRWWHGGPAVDVGVGCGSFIEYRPHTWGYDVNPAAIAWLQDNERFWDPYVDPCLAVTMWDSLEHIPRFGDLLGNVLQWAFIAIPVFKDEEDVMASKHFRPDEHTWYFTPDGLKAVMADLGWGCREENDIETQLGRESIRSFAFERVDD